MPVSIVEKDYYITMILKGLSQKAPECVFKEGTSLSKCYHVIDRFSEDIDISFSNTLTQGERRKLRNEIIAALSKELELPIIDWDRWIVNMFLDNFFKVIFPILYWCLIVQ